MAHSVAEAAARAVKNSQRVQVETRTPEQRLSDIRKNRAAKLFITPDDQDFLLMQYDFRGEQIRQFTITRDEEDARIAELRGTINLMVAEDVRLNAVIDEYRTRLNVATKHIADLNDKIEEFRTVYEDENRSMALKIERIAGDPGAAPTTENV